MTTAPADGQRVVVLTGAASGIGYATAELFRDGEACLQPVLMEARTEIGSAEPGVPLPL